MIAHTAGVGRSDLGWGTQLINYSGHLGVAIFFCISGFLLYRPFLVATVNDTPMPAFRTYIIRRLLRIVPLYWVALFAYAFLFPAGPNDLPHNATGWIATIFFGQEYVPGGVFWGVKAAWTLNIEMAFYFVLPPISWGIAKLARSAGKSIEERLTGVMVGLLAVSLVSIAYKIWVHETLIATSELQSWMPAYLDWFACGMAMAVAVFARDAGLGLPKWLVSLGRWPGVSWFGGLALFAASGQLAFYNLIFPDSASLLARHFVTLAAGALIVVPAIIGDPSKGLIRGFLNTRPMQSLGLISYGIYLWHPGFVVAFYNWAYAGFLRIGETRWEWAPSISPFVQLALVFCATIPLATLTYWGVERPCLDLKQYFPIESRRAQSRRATQQAES